MYDSTIKDREECSLVSIKEKKLIYAQTAHFYRYQNVSPSFSYAVWSSWCWVVMETAQLLPDKGDQYRRDWQNKRVNGEWLLSTHCSSAAASR